VFHGLAEGSDLMAPAGPAAGPPLAVRLGLPARKFIARSAAAPVRPDSPMSDRGLPRVRIIMIGHWLATRPGPTGAAAAVLARAGFKLDGPTGTGSLRERPRQRSQSEPMHRVP
jgi:hypothetical protein